MSFKERFLDAEASFMAALSSEPSALTQFDLQWEVLAKDFELAVSTGPAMKADEIALVHGVASRIAILGDSLIKLQEASTRITAKTLTELEIALQGLALEDGREEKQPLKFRPFTSPYVPAALSWLLENLHDPYPPTSLKRVWARDAGLTLRSMDDWFKSIRKQIGWVSFTKAHFKGSRSMAVRAAGVVFLDNGDHGRVPFEVQTELLAIKARLQNLFLEERGLATEPAIESETSRSSSPSMQSDTSSESISISSSSPSSRLPSLILDQSDSEDDERLPEFPTLDIFDNTSIHIAALAKDDNVAERRLERTQYVFCRTPHRCL